MARNVKLLEATMTQLRGKALEHLASAEILLDNPTGVIDHPNYVDEIINHIREVMICENAMNALKMYFVPQSPGSESPGITAPARSGMPTAPRPTTAPKVEATGRPTKKKS